MTILKFARINISLSDAAPALGAEEVAVADEGRGTREWRLTDLPDAAPDAEGRRLADGLVDDGATLGALGADARWFADPPVAATTWYA